MVTNTSTNLWSVYQPSYRLENREIAVRFPAVGKRLSSITSRRDLWSTQRPIQWLTGAPSVGVQRLRSETGHSLLLHAEVLSVLFKNAASC